MTDKEKQILKGMGLKFKFVGSEVIIQGKISLTDYNKIMNTKPGTKTPKIPPKPPVWAQTLIANQATDHALLIQLVTAVNTMQKDITEMKNTPTMKKELNSVKP